MKRDLSILLRDVSTLLRDVARGEIGPGIAARAQSELDAIEAFVEGPKKSPRCEKAPIASVAHAEARREDERAAAKTQRQEVRAAVMERARGFCEACGSRRGAALHLDHFHGRAREESVESCWALCPSCDDQKTHNRPSRAFWLRRFRTHCKSHGYAEQISKCSRLIDLEYAQHPEQLPPSPADRYEEPTPCPF